MSLPDLILLGIFLLGSIATLGSITEGLSQWSEALRVPRQYLSREKIGYKALRRDLTALLLFIPVFILSSRCTLQPLCFLIQYLPQSIQSSSLAAYLTPIALVALGVVLRRIGASLCHLIKPFSGAENIRAVLSVQRTMSMFGSLTISALFLLLTFFISSKYTLSIVLLAVFAFFWLNGIVSEFQILRTSFLRFKVFLYLCALELFPAGATAAIMLALI